MRIALFKVALPELDRLPAERRKAIIEGFNSSPEAAALRARLSKLPIQFATVVLMVVLGIMVLVYDVGFVQCTLVGLLCFVFCIPVGILAQITLLNRALRKYVQKSSNLAV
jgi:hypothetical protein